MLPDFVFEKNSTDILYLINGRGDSVNVLVDTVMSKWIESWKAEFTKSTWKTKIVIESFAGYDESNSISRKRLKLIYKKLIDLGISKKVLVKSNRNKRPREYCKYRDGCHPYYLIKNQPVIIDRYYMATLTDKNIKHLRQVVTFTWRFKQ